MLSRERRRGGGTWSVPIPHAQKVSLNHDDRERERRERERKNQKIRERKKREKKQKRRERKREGKKKKKRKGGEREEPCLTLSVTDPLGQSLLLFPTRRKEKKRRGSAILQLSAAQHRATVHVVG